jgi:TolB-like protein
VSGAALVGLAAIAVGALWWRSLDIGREEASVPGGVAASIAVLPLENLGPADEEYFADGMTDALITHLAKIEALKVISRRSVMQFKGIQKSLPEIARELGVETVLTGTVLRAGNRVRISTHLVDAGTDRSLWADSYERDMSDILVLQGEVARAIASAVEVEVEPEEKARIATSRTVDPEAHEAYLMGLAAAVKGYSGVWDYHQESAEVSFGYFQRAIELEPEWAEPYGQLALLYQATAGLGGPETQSVFYPKAKAVALRAIELDDTAAAAHAALARILLNHEWNWTAAEYHYLQATKVDPNHGTWIFDRFLTLAGRYDEAAEILQKARERNPTSLTLRYRTGLNYLCAGRPREAEMEARALLNVAPENYIGHLLLGRAFLSTSRYREAVTEFEKVRHDLARFLWNSGLIPYARAKAGDLVGARQLLEDLEANQPDFWCPELYVALGQEDKAMALIETAFERHRDVLLLIRCNPEYERLMEIPRFREIIDAIGFPS